MVRIVGMVKTYQSAPLLHGCLQSLQGQVDRIIVADGWYPPEIQKYPKGNGSSDESFEIVRGFSNAEWLPAPSDPYPSEVTKINAMLHLARTGEWTLWIDTDEKLRGSLREYIPLLGYEEDVLPMRIAGPGFGEAHFYFRLLKKLEGMSCSRLWCFNYGGPSPTVNCFLGDYHEKCWIEHS